MILYNKTQNDEYDVYTIFGIKIKIFNCSRYAKKLTQRIDKSFIVQDIYSAFGCTEDLLNYLKLIEKSRSLWKTLDKKIWLIYISCLLQIDDKQEAINVLNKYIYFYGTALLEKFLPIANFAYENKIKNELIEKSKKIYDAFIQTKGALREKLIGKTIAIVGNGPSEIGKNKGQEIDEHDIVIRCNNFNTQGYEKDYGSKTDFWCCNLINDIKYRRPEYDIILPLAIDGREVVKLDILLEAINNGKKIFCYDMETITELNRQLSYYPTLGLCLAYGINKLLGSLKNVDFYGFNFCNEKYDKYTYHYFKDRTKTQEETRITYHDIYSESEFFVDFIQKNKL